MRVRDRGSGGSPPLAQRVSLPRQMLAAWTPRHTMQGLPVVCSW